VPLEADWGLFSTRRPHLRPWDEEFFGISVSLLGLLLLGAAFPAGLPEAAALAEESITNKLGCFRCEWIPFDFWLFGSDLSQVLSFSQGLRSSKKKKF
jgi:hypothetical protein